MASSKGYRHKGETSKPALKKNGEKQTHGHKMSIAVAKSNSHQIQSHHTNHKTGKTQTYDYKSESGYKSEFAVTKQAHHPNHAMTKSQPHNYSHNHSYHAEHLQYYGVAYNKETEKKLRGKKAETVKAEKVKIEQIVLTRMSMRGNASVAAAAATATSTSTGRVRAIIKATAPMMSTTEGGIERSFQRSNHMKVLSNITHK